MKFVSLVVLIVVVGCAGLEESDPRIEEQQLEQLVYNLHDGLRDAYTGRSVDTDSLINVYYDPLMYYITPWGSSEPIESTRVRLKNALPIIRDYEYSIERLQTRSLGRGGYASFILRQAYSIRGFLLDEYLPTTFVFEKSGDGWKIVHAQRTTDYQTMQQYVEMQKQLGNDQ